jgi:hypothetical protein
MNLFSKKIYFLIQKKNSPICTLKIFDIEEEKCFTQKLYLKVIKTLSGISQLNINNTLYFCGINEINNDNNSVGSYMFKIKYSNFNPSLYFLVNSVYTHIYPSMSLWKNEIIIIIGGKDQIECEGYLINQSKWIDLPPLPEDRFRCSLFPDEKNNLIYLFGGLSTITNNNMKNILRMNMELCDKWDMILIKENEGFLARNSSVAFMFDNSDIIYICGGKNNNGEETEYICEYNITNKSVKKSKHSMKNICSFDMQGFGDLNKNYFAFIDNSFIVHSISRNDFRMMVIPFEQLSLDQKD